MRSLDEYYMSYFNHIGRQTLGREREKVTHE